MKKKSFTKTLISSLILGGLTSSAFAGVITDTGSFSIGSSTIYDQEHQGSNNSVTSQTTNTSLQLNGFDSSLGTLTGVEIAFNSSWSLNGQVQGWDNNDQAWIFNWEKVSATGTSSSNMSVTLTNPSDSAEEVIQSVTQSCSGNGATSAYCSNSTGNSGGFNETMDLASINLNAFLDTTLILEFERTITAEILQCGQGSPNDDYCRMSNYNNAWGGNAVVQYTYDEFIVPVSEPAPLALFGLGLVGLGFARRRQA